MENNSCVCVYFSGFLLQRNYVICQVMYKGADGDSLYGNNSNALSHSMVSDLNTVREINTAPQVSTVSDNVFQFFISIIKPI